MSDPDRYRVNDEVTAKILGGEAIMINLSTGAYYSLGGAGAHAWALLTRGQPVEEVAAELSGRYGVEAETARTDVERLLRELREEHLLEPLVGDPPGEPLDDTDLPQPGEYVPPALEAYSDMSDLLALDPPMPGIRDIPWQSPEQDQTRQQ